MSTIEYYEVTKTKTLGSPVDRYKLWVKDQKNLPAPNPTPVSAILLVKVTDPAENRTGQEEGDGSATVYLVEDDFDLAVEHIDKTDEVSYQSEAIAGTGAPGKADIWNFSFPEVER